MSGKVFAIGDVHGCIDELDCLLDAIGPGSGDQVVFLGDYVDRGPDAKSVIDRLIRLRREHGNVIFLKGNHEDMFLSYLGLGGNHGDVFIENGGRATLRSYGIDTVPRTMAGGQLPEEHTDFLLALQLMHQHGRFLMVHAGFDPRRPLDRQREEDLLWIRGEFTEQPHDFGCTVVYGHTPYRDVHWHVPYKLGLDTGAVYGNLLSCCELNEGRIVQVKRENRSIRSRSLPNFEHAAVGSSGELTSERLRRP